MTTKMVGSCAERDDVSKPHPETVISRAEEHFQEKKKKV